MDYIKNFNFVNKPVIIELLKKYSFKTIYIFQNRDEADTFLIQK